MEEPGSMNVPVNGNDPLSDRIAQALDNEALWSAADLAALIGETEDELQRLERETARKVSLDPRARADAIEKARQDYRGPGLSERAPDCRYL